MSLTLILMEGYTILSFYSIWTVPKRFGLDHKQIFTAEYHVQKVLISPKKFGWIQNSFGLIEEQVIFEFRIINVKNVVTIDEIIVV